jgi:hypothetical protein
MDSAMAMVMVVDVEPRVRTGVCLRRLRTELQPDPSIETVRGAGYCIYHR